MTLECTLDLCLAETFIATSTRIVLSSSYSFTPQSHVLLDPDLYYRPAVNFHGISYAVCPKGPGWGGSSWLERAHHINPVTLGSS